MKSRPLCIFAEDRSCVGDGTEETIYQCRLGRGEPRHAPGLSNSGQTYQEGTSHSQEGGWSPLWALAGQGAISVGNDVISQVAKRFRQSFCEGEGDEEAPPQKKKKKTQKGGWLPFLPWLQQLGANGDTFELKRKAAQRGAG